ncbi:MAG: hypothetical protein QOI21_2981 [Actinomycetota bacterium]|jgi:hypothetical protein|nr:hypothetical protein [Actinomycetota bacterium]
MAAPQRVADERHSGTLDFDTASPRYATRWAWLLAATAIIPTALAGLAAVRAPRIHVLLDYWHVLTKITNDDGSLIPGELFSYHLDQPFLVPSLLFWADAAWFGGDNRALTVLTVLLAVAMVALLVSMLPATLTPIKRAALGAGFTFLILSSHAMELWVQATNGISWIPAVFFSVLAIALAHRGQLWPAFLAAALGCLCFGAAFPVWFALSLILWLRRSPRLAVVIPGAIGILVIGFWFATKPAGGQSLATTAFDPDGRLSTMAAAVGGLWSADLALAAIIAGGLTITALTLLATTTIHARATQSVEASAEAGWIGLGAYALALAVMLALGRTSSSVPGGNVGLISRYVIVAALATCAVLVLITRRRPAWPTRYVVAMTLTLALATHAIGGAKAAAVQRDYAPLRLAEIALRVNAPATLNALRIQPAAIPAATALRAYPFTDDFTLSCHEHELGGQLPLNTAIPLPLPGAPGTDHGVIDTPLAADTILSGWASLTGAAGDCVLVTDRNGTIIGAGITGLDHPSAAATGWHAVAPPGATELHVLVLKSGQAYQLQPPTK